MADRAERLRALRAHIDTNRVFGATEALELIDLLLEGAPKASQAQMPSNDAATQKMPPAPAPPVIPQTPTSSDSSQGGDPSQPTQ